MSLRGTMRYGNLEMIMFIAEYISICTLLVPLMMDN